VPQCQRQVFLKEATNFFERSNGENVEEEWWNIKYYKDIKYKYITFK
jgi:hypothetical protein